MPYTPSGRTWSDEWMDGWADRWMDIVINDNDDMNIQILLNSGTKKECN
jgi:hypothetical protein